MSVDVTTVAAPINLSAVPVKLQGLFRVYYNF
jgi:hypothetical protein